MKKSKSFIFICVVIALTTFVFSCQKEILTNAEEMASLKKGKASDLTPMELLGKNIFFDKISSPGSMACAACHAPEVGFTGPISGINHQGSVYRGADPHRFGNRKPPSAAYATFSPIFHYDSAEELFIGGNFWDGRATGEHYFGNTDVTSRNGLPSAEQALGPFLNPVEQNNPSMEAVLMKIAASKYAGLWEEAWGDPIGYGNDVEIKMNYDRIGLSIAAYEASTEVNPFSSKYDAYVAGEAELTDQESMGLRLYVRKAMCSACHPNDGEHALFTDFTFDNLGVPKNPNNPFYDMDEVYLDDGSAINPEGENWVDYGLGGYLATLSSTNPRWASLARENAGKHKVPTLRNVGKKNGNGFVKAYTHNGVFLSLKDVVHFYNTRDVKKWPAPEVPQNVNTEELGNLGLSDEEEDAVVAFLMTLSDGYKMK